MAEDNNEDMSIEDILSSIKDILNEETPSPAPTQAPTVVEAEAISEPEPVVEVDDVLDLSPAMRIASPFEEEAVDTSPFPFASDEENDPLSLDEMLDDNAPLFNIEDAIEDNGVDELLNNEVAEEALVDSESDPFYEESVATPSYEELEASNYAAETEEVLSVEPEVEEEYAYEDTPNFEPISESEDVYVSEPQPIPVVAENDAVDVSANIISNFAKMFANEEVTTPAVYTPAVKPEIIGDGSKTIEDAVMEVIRSIIGSEVATNWRQGADYDHFATQEIQSQTKIWLDTNLPALVERIVKQEIERVMAKVGSHQ